MLLLSGTFSTGTADSKAQPPGLDGKLTKGLSDIVKSTPPNEKVRVGISLKKHASKTKSKVARGSVKNDIVKNGGKVVWEYSTFEGITAEVPAARVRGLANNPNIEMVVEDVEVKLHLQESIPLIGVDDVWKNVQGGLNMTGKGQTVCIIDTGIDYNHPDLSGNYIAGYDYVYDDSFPLDDNGHGTHVAGIIAANGTLKGVAPDAKIIAIKALSSTGGGFASDVSAGIDFCVANANAYNITVISMSLGGGNYSSYCDNADFTNIFYYKDSINAAIAKNISVVVSTGNEAYNTSMTTPACIENATRVGATYDVNSAGVTWMDDSVTVCSDSPTKTDNVTCNTNRGTNFPDMLLAPGYEINSTYLSYGYASLGGTSMAAPHVSGLIALLNQKYKAGYGVNPNSSYLFNRMNQTGVQIFDYNTSSYYSRINATAAYNSVPDKITPTTTATPSGRTYGSEVTVTLSANEEATIYYDYNVTVNGITRNDKSVFSNVYLGPIGITTNTTLTFYAVDLAGNVESPNEANYTIDYLYPQEFYDDFEIEKHWVMNEEIVGGDDIAYGAGIGRVNRSKDTNHTGSYSLRVWPNKAGSNKTNHVIGGKKISDVGRGGKWLYEIYAYIDPQYNETGQTGPEIALHNIKRNATGDYITYEAGIQYQACCAGNWAIWNGTTFNQSSWNVFWNKPLESGKWYYVAFEVDYDAGNYTKFWLRGDGIDEEKDISDRRIAWLDKWEEEGFSVSAEAENNWSSDSDIYNYTAYYDNFNLTDTKLPSMNITSPKNKTYADASIELNVTVSEYANASYSLNGAANVSLFNISTAINTTITAAEGQNNITVYTIDAAGGNLNYSTLYFIYDPLISYHSNDLDDDGDLWDNNFTASYNASSNSANWSGSLNTINIADANTGVGKLVIINESGLLFDSNEDGDLSDTDDDYTIYSGVYITDANSGIVQFTYEPSFNTSYSNGDEDLDIGEVITIKGDKYLVVDNETSDNDIELGPAIALTLDTAPIDIDSRVNISGDNKTYYNGTTGRLYFYWMKNLVDSVNITDSSVCGKFPCMLGPPHVTSDEFIGYYSADDGYNISVISVNSTAAKVVFVRRAALFTLTNGEKDVFGYNSTKINDSGFPKTGEIMFLSDNLTLVEGGYAKVPDAYYSVYYKDSTIDVLRRNSTAPKITSGPSASSITTSAATINWSTDREGNSTLEYGTTVGYGSNSTNESYETNHSMKLTGLSSSTTYHYRVMSSDRVGNKNTSSDRTFTTSSSGKNTGGGGGGGGSPSPSVPKVTATVEEGKVEVKIDFIPLGSPITVSIPETDDMPLKSLDINVNKKLSNVLLTISELDEKPSNITNPIAGPVSNYLQIDTNIDDADIDNVTQSFKVPVSWMDEKGIEEDSIVMNRFQKEEWEVLETEKTSEDSDYAYYLAVSPGFSVFAISGIEKSIDFPSFPMVTAAPPSKAPVTAAPLSQSTAQDSNTSNGGQSKFIVMLGLSILAVLMIVGIAFYKFGSGEDNGKEEGEQEK